MIKFAIKSLVVMILVGHAINLVEPGEPVSASADPHFMPATYTMGSAAEVAEPDVARNLSTVTNAQIVVSSATRDAAGFCEREPLACQSSRELVLRMATGLRDFATGVVNWADGDETDSEAGSNPDTEYRPLVNYSGAYPLLPAAPPARQDSL